MDECRQYTRSGTHMTAAVLKGRQEEHAGGYKGLVQPYMGHLILGVMP